VGKNETAERQVALMGLKKRSQGKSRRKETTPNSNPPTACHRKARGKEKRIRAVTPKKKTLILMGYGGGRGIGSPPHTTGTDQKRGVATRRRNLW